MSAELDSALVALGYVALFTLFSLNVLIASKTYGWFNDRTITLKGEVATKLKGELTTGSADNIYTELAAGKQTKAAELNLEAQKIALKVAETNERTEATRLERTRLEQRTPSA